MSFIDAVIGRFRSNQPDGLDFEPDDFFYVVTRSRRRFAIRAVADCDGPIDLSTLASRLAADESPRDVAPEEVLNREYKRAEVSLYQTHLPELVDAGLVEWDRDRRVVLPTPRTASAAELIDEIEAAIDEHRGLPVAGAGVEPLDAQAVYELLRIERRRHVVSLLADVGAGGETTTGWLAENVAAIETEHGVDAIPSDVRKSRYVTIYQCHIPKLDEAGVVRWEGRGPVAVTDRIAVLAAAMQTAERGLSGGADS